MTDRPTTIDDWDEHRRADRERVRRLAAEMNTVVDELAPHRQRLTTVHRCDVQAFPDPDCPLHGGERARSAFDLIGHNCPTCGRSTVTTTYIRTNPEEPVNWKWRVRFDACGHTFEEWELTDATA